MLLIDLKLLSCLFLDLPDINITSNGFEIEERKFTLECEASVKEDTVLTYQWYFTPKYEEVEILLDDKQSRELIFASITPNDAGTYRCQVANEVVNADASTEVVVSCKLVLYTYVTKLLFFKNYNCDLTLLCTDQ